MIGEDVMPDVGRRPFWHMAVDATIAARFSQSQIALAGGDRMTGYAFAVEVGRGFRGRRFEMRVVAARAGHPFAAFLLAGASLECFDVAGRN